MIIYKITNKFNMKSYIGKTVFSIEDRWKRHCSASRNGSKFRFHSAIRKYGENSFDLSIIDTASNENELNIKEKYWIDYYNTCFYGYNATTGGTGGWVVKDKESWKSNQHSRVGINNGNSCGLTDDQILEIAIEYCVNFNRIPGYETLVEWTLKNKNIKIPKSFSKNRFKGNKNIFFKQLEEKTGLKYNPTYKSPEHREKIRIAKLGKKRNVTN